jgi:hypothetical protein
MISAFNERLFALALVFSFLYTASGILRENRLILSIALL